MRKIILFFLTVAIILSFFGCSRDRKMGIGEFTERLEKDFEAKIDIQSMTAEKQDGKNKVYCVLNSNLLVFYTGTGDNITGIAAMISKENEENLSIFLEDFAKCVSIFTLNSVESVTSTMREYEITADKIKFTDGNSLFTVGKYKYSVITNEMSITLFCERV